MTKLIWKRIPKENSSQPSEGTYSNWKEIIAQECFFQCVYCAIKEKDFGGIRNFHVEHYKPKSRFPELTNDIKNLFYSCSICNVLKGNDWPGEPNEELSNPSYPNPSVIDYNGLFFMEDENYEIVGKFISSIYMIEKLYLNRPQLIILRRTYDAFMKLEKSMSYFLKIKSSLEGMEDTKVIQFLKRLNNILVNVVELQLRIRKLRPYEECDIKR